MKKQQIIFMILLLGMINGPDNSHAQEVMCPMDATGSPAAPPATLHVGVILVQFSDW